MRFRRENEADRTVVSRFLLAERDGIDEFLHPRVLSDENDIIPKYWKIACVARSPAGGGTGRKRQRGALLRHIRCWRAKEDVNEFYEEMCLDNFIVEQSAHEACSFASGSRMGFFKQERDGPTAPPVQMCSTR